MHLRHLHTNLLPLLFTGLDELRDTTAAKIYPKLSNLISRENLSRLVSLNFSGLKTETSTQKFSRVSFSRNCGPEFSLYRGNLRSNLLGNLCCPRVITITEISINVTTYLLLYRTVFIHVIGYSYTDVVIFEVYEELKPSIILDKQNDLDTRTVCIYFALYPKT